MHSNQQIAEQIRNLSEELADKVLEKQFQIQPELKKKYSSREIKLYKQDTKYYFSYLAEAIANNQIQLFEEYLRWCKTFFMGLKIPVKDLLINLELIRDQLKDNFSEEGARLIEQYMNAGIEAFKGQQKKPESFITRDDTLESLAGQYLNALLNVERRKALDLIMQAHRDGVSIKDIYLKVFQPVQHEIGRLWQLNQISVAQEHYVTASTQLIMSQLYPYLFSDTKKDKNMLVSCISGELHEIGARMVADFFEMEGWNTFYMGANTPLSSIIQTIKEYDASLLAVSATMTFNLDSVRQLIDDVKQKTGNDHLRVIVGGYPFNTANDLWKRVGADGYAPDAGEAIDLANRLVG